MNYANMIEEKNLKKTFIIATLCSTLIGTFTSSIGLWDRVADRRKQKKTDGKQDDEIKKLREQVDKTEKELKRRDEVPQNFEKNQALIQREYDQGYGRMGKKFAIGDSITENQLQGQVINLQSSVIQVLQNAMTNDRKLTRDDLAKLISASNTAREGSVDALRGQQQRLAIEAGPQSSISTPPSSRRSSTVISHHDSAAPLYCPYSQDLQYMSSKPLSAHFAPGGDCCCPACGMRVGATAEDYWQIGKRTPIVIADAGYEKEVIETREFRLGQRFVIKCHTGNGEYACVLCHRHRDVDAICRTVDSLVKHVGRFHDIEELEREVDLKEGRPLPLLMPPPPAPAPPPASKQTKGIEVREYVR